MDLRGKSVIVTGAAGGIGAAIADRALARGARVTLSDLAPLPLELTARDLDARHPGQVANLAGDAADAETIEALVRLAIQRFGSVDVYVANAGVFRGFGLEAAEDEWAASWEVNVMAHVRAARVLVPLWQESATGGCFAVTASAAGLLTQIGSPVYSTTKHAAVGFAEWLAATYGDRGVQVCCLCPMGVRTPMVESASGSEDAEARLGMAAVTSAGVVLEPAFVADVLVDAIEHGHFLAVPHPEVLDMFRAKASDHDRWLSGMRRYRQTLIPDGTAP
ncbi:MAG: dehydrogenase [Nocardioides sp.]|nr:dehydrogenase [Nocardioides sp.]